MLWAFVRLHFQSAAVHCHSSGGSHAGVSSVCSPARSYSPLGSPFGANGRRKATWGLHPNIARLFRNEVAKMNDKSDVPQNRAFAHRCYAWSRAIHWVTVALVSGVLITALFENIDPHGSGNDAFLWHSFLGLSVYLLTITRVLLWFVYRPTACGAAEPDTHRGLRTAFYALLIALPISGWWLASEEGMPAHVFGIPALPQWYQQEGAEHSGSTDSQVDRENAARAAPVVRYLARLHASLGAALAIVIALHLLTVFRTRRQRTHGRKPEFLNVDRDKTI